VLVNLGHLVGEGADRSSTPAAQTFDDADHEVPPTAQRLPTVDVRLAPLWATPGG
jgi:hypothetical protein